jgi:Uncharacterized protein conserved in bacteria
MNENTCCFTGHRRLPADKIGSITRKLEYEVEQLIKKGVTDFISGGALGFDQMAASLIIAKKQMGKDIRLIFALPCKNQDERWNDKQKTFYKDLLKEADEIFYTSESYHATCMKGRNQFMVEHSMHCICALLHDRSGTSSTVRYAYQKGLNVRNVAK